MTRSFVVQPNCVAVDMPDGTKYTARHGVVDVDDRHAGIIEQSFSHRGPGYIEKRLGVLPRNSIAGVTCSSCLFNQFACFSHQPCPRCGGDDWKEQP